MLPKYLFSSYLYTHSNHSFLFVDSLIIPLYEYVVGQSKVHAVTLGFAGRTLVAIIRPHWGDFVPGSGMCATNLPADNICQKHSHIFKVYVLNNIQVLFRKFIETSLKILSQTYLEVYDLRNL